MQIKTCAKCKEPRTLDQFKYLATLAQTKAWGRAGNVRMEITSKLCKDCRPKRKPRTKLTKKDIHNKVQTGDLNAYLAQNLLIVKQRTSHNAQAKAARKRWVKEWREELKATLEPLTKEIAHARKVWRYSNSKGYVDKAEFYFEYHALLHHEKTHAQYSHMLHPRRPASSRWEDFVSDEVFAKVRDMWAGLPPIHKYTSRLPLLIKHRPDGDK